MHCQARPRRAGSSSCCVGKNTPETAGTGELCTGRRLQWLFQQSGQSRGVHALVTAGFVSVVRLGNIKLHNRQSFSLSTQPHCQVEKGKNCLISCKQSSEVPLKHPTPRITTEITILIPERDRLRTAWLTCTQQQVTEKTRQQTGISMAGCLVFGGLS